MKATQLLHPDEGAERILSLISQADEREEAEGRVWYLAAHDSIREICRNGPRRGGDRVTTRRACAVTAALSPGSRWERNLSDLSAMLQWAADGFSPLRRPAFGTYNANVLKAKMVCVDEAGERWLRGPKVTAFAKCLSQPLSRHGAVCVDRHAIRAYQGQWLADDKHGQVRISPKMYETVAQGYRTAAEMKGWRPMEMQAVAWVVIKRLTSTTAL